MSKKLGVVVPRLASTVLLITQNHRHTVSHASGGNDDAKENDIDVLMVKRHSKARFMPRVYVFPGGGVEVADCEVARDYLASNCHVRIPQTATAQAADAGTHFHSFIEAKVDPSPEEGETEAWACRMGALRELAEETGCVLQHDHTVCTAAQWRESSTPASSGAAPPTIYDVQAAPLLRPLGRWVTPRHFKYRYDTYFYAALVRGAFLPPSTTPTTATETAGLAAAQDLPLVGQASEVAGLLWLSPMQALRRHENTSDTFSLAPPTFLLLHALARQPSYAALAATWAKEMPAPPAAAATAGASNHLGTLPYSSVMPCIEPRHWMTKDGKYIEDFLLPEHYFYEKGWSEPEGAYRFCGEAFDGHMHKIRMLVGSNWMQKMKEGRLDLSQVALRELTH